MTALNIRPRRVCRVCGNDFATRKDGTLLMHRRRTSQGYKLDWCRGGTRRRGVGRRIRCVCCGDTGLHGGLGLISRCYNRHRAHGTIDQFAHHRTGAGQASAAVRMRRVRPVLALVAGGMGNEQIAGALQVATDTVKADLKIIYRRLGARNRAHAVALAHRLEVIGPRPEPDIDATVEGLAAIVTGLLRHPARQAS